MAKARHGEWGAFTNKGGIRFQKKNLMISEDSVPPEVRQLLKRQLGIREENIVPPIQTPKFPRPSEEELARMRAESVKVKPELQLTPEEEALRQQVGVPDNEVPLSPDDFEVDEDTEDWTPPDLPDMTPNESLEPTNPLAQPDSINTSAVGNPTGREVIDSDFLESVSVHSAPLEVVVQALYERFGIYTVYLGALPRADEVNPLTGSPFTKYHLGIAYQAAIQAQNRGIQNPEIHRQAIDKDRAASAGFKDSFVPVAHTFGEARQQNNFAYRTSVKGNQGIPATEVVHEIGKDGVVRAVQREIPIEERLEHGSGAGSRFSKDDDEQIVEPPIFGTKPIIKPSW